MSTSQASRLTDSRATLLQGVPLSVELSRGRQGDLIRGVPPTLIMCRLLTQIGRTSSTPLIHGIGEANSCEKA